MGVDFRTYDWSLSPNGRFLALIPDKDKMQIINPTAKNISVIIDIKNQKRIPWESSDKIIFTPNNELFLLNKNEGKLYTANLEKNNELTLIADKVEEYYKSQWQKYTIEIKVKNSKKSKYYSMAEKNMLKITMSMKRSMPVKIKL